MYGTICGISKQTISRRRKMRVNAVVIFLLTLVIFVGCKTTPVNSNGQALLSKVTTTEHRQRLFQSGYALYGYSLQDQWKLFMNPDSVVAVLSPDLHLNAVLYQKYPNQFRNDSEVYELANRWRITLFHQACFDSATKQTQPYQLLLQRDSVNLFGCGYDLYDTRINGKWALTHVQGGLTASAHTAKAPFVEIDAEQQRISGRIACNRVNGSFRVRGKQIQAGYLATTRMACSDVIEMVFLKLYDHPTSYQVNDSLLILTNAAGETMQFERLK